MNLLTAFRKEWLEALRNYRLLIVVVVLAFFGMTSPLLAKITPQIVTAVVPQGTDISQIIPTPTVRDAIAQYVKNMGQFSIVLALLLGMGSVVQEKEKGTAAMMLVKPLPRGSFLGAKYLGLASIFAISIVIAGIGSYYYTLLLFETMSAIDWLLLNIFLFLYVLVIIAISLFCSTVTKSQAAAGGMAAGIIASGLIIGAIRGLGKYLPGELITWGVRLMQGDTSPSWLALGISLGLILVPLFAAWLIFKNQEI
jgi:ABC-2 type transport system permease protein